MNKSDMETLSRFEQMFAQDAQKISTPERLSRDSIVALLENAQSEKVVPISSAKSNRFRPFGKIAAVAACFIMILAVAALARNSTGHSDLGIKNAFEGLKIDNLIKKITSKEELDLAVSEIIEDNAARGNSAAGTETSAGNEDISVSAQEEASIVVEKPGSGFTAVNDSAREADIVKYHNDMLFVLTPAVDSSTSAGTQVIKIIGTGEKGGMKEISSIAPYESDAVSLSDECLEMYINGSTLVAVISRRDFSGSSSAHHSKNSTVTLFYDISDPSAPALLATNEQDGSYICSEIRNGRLCLVTTGNVSGMPALTAQGRRYTLSADKEEIAVAENAREDAYLFITETNAAAPGGEIAMLGILGCGANSEISICENGIYIARQLSAVDTGEKRTEIYCVSDVSGRLALAGTYSFSGSLCAGVNADSGDGVYIIYSPGDSMYACTLTADLRSTGNETALDCAADLPVSFIGSTAYISGGDESRAVHFSGADIQIFTASAHALNAKTIELTDDIVIEIGSSASDGGTLITYYSGNGDALDSFRLGPDVSVLLGDSRALIADPSGYFGIPVIVSAGGSERSSYILYRVSGASVQTVGEFVHESSFAGDAATRAVIEGDTLYTVSGAKIKAFSVSANEEIESYIY